MTPEALLDDLARRGIWLSARGNRIRVNAPRGVLTEADRQALVARKAEVLALLRAEQPPARTEPSDRRADDVPEGPCGLCGSPLAWVVDWPMAGDACWLCPTCAAWPAPALAELFANLNGDERRRLDTEAALGDKLAVAVLRELRGDRGPAARCTTPSRTATAARVLLAANCGPQTPRRAPRRPEPSRKRTSAAATGAAH